LLSEFIPSDSHGPGVAACSLARISSILFMIALPQLKSNRLKATACIFEFCAEHHCASFRVNAISASASIRQLHTLVLAVFGFIIITPRTLHILPIPSNLPYKKRFVLGYSNPTHFF